MYQYPISSKAAIIDIPNDFCTIYNHHSSTLLYSLLPYSLSFVCLHKKTYTFVYISRYKYRPKICPK